MKTKMTKKNQKGGSAVEFMLVAPLLFALFFCIIEGGLALYNLAVITNASREGARNGIVLRNNNTEAAVETIVYNTVINYTTSRLISFDGNETPNHSGNQLDPPPDFSDENGDGEIDAGESLTVRVEYPYSFLALPNLAALLRGSYSKTVLLRARTIMRFE